MRDFIREAVLRLVEIKGTVGFSVNTFEDLLKWGANLHCENNEAARGHWPLSWEDVQTWLGDIGFKMPKLYYICLDSSYPCLYPYLWVPEGTRNQEIIFDSILGIAAGDWVIEFTTWRDV